MRFLRSPVGIGSIVGVVAAIVTLFIVGGGDEDGDRGSATTTTGAGALERATGPAGEQIEATVREYVAAINSRSGVRVCALLVPGAEAELDPPKKRGDCAATLSASIGYADPRGFPVWKRTRIVRFVSVREGDDAARATVEVRHRFADRPTPSVEDDVIYLQRQGDRWLVAKPSSTLYRAIGVAEIPLSAVSPP